jgi:peptidoglycan/LPS O-acetylase OafA/YrhL
VNALRGICGVMAGFVLAIAVIAVCERAAIVNFNVRTIGSGYMLASVAWTIVGAVAGGFMAAWIAGSREVPWAAGVGFLLVLLSLVAMRRQGNAQPGWYETAVAGCGPISALIGGAIRLLTKPRRIAPRSERPLASQAGDNRRSA